MFFRRKTSRPTTPMQVRFVVCAALVLLAAGLGQGVPAVPPATDVDRAFPHRASDGLQVLPPNTDPQQQVFITEAGQLNLLETRLGQLALQKSSRSAVQDYARRMIADHRRLNEELAAVARTSHFTVPQDLEAPGAKTAARLAALRGADFDTAYLDASVSDHEAGLAEFQSAAAGIATSGVPLPSVIQWARQTVPLLREQLRLGQNTSQGLEEAKTSGGM
jgi:putative membrane protein